MKQKTFVIAYLFLVLTSAILTQLYTKLPSGPAPRSKVPDAVQTQLVEAFGKLPLSFEANLGQTEPQVKFLSRGNGYTLFLTSTEAVLTLRKNTTNSASDLHSNKTDLIARWEYGRVFRHQTDEHRTLAKDFATSGAESVLRMKLAGANSDPEMVGLEELPGKSNYFIGNDPAQWRTQVPTYAKVKYQDIYPGIDLIYYGNQRQVEYDFVLAPGADPSLVRLDIQGADQLEINKEGDLVLYAAGEQLRLRKPTIFQEEQGEWREISGGYSLQGQTQVGFEVAAYDPNQPLIIDPVLVYSTYLGGSGSEQIEGIALDSSGNIYVTGRTTSTNFPMMTPLRATNGGGDDAFVAKLNPAGSALVYSTYLGGAGNDHGHGLAIDSSGSVYVAGDTTSTNFPIANALQGANAGETDIIVARLNATGSALVFSTYLGGRGEDFGTGVAVDASGNVILTGFGDSANFPTAVPLQAALSGVLDAVVAKLNSVGSTLVFSTYLGGSGLDIGTEIAVDSSGNIFVTGITDSANFPTLNPFQGLFGGGTCGSGQDTFACPDAFVTKLNSAGSALIYSTYLGGSGDDEGFDIAVDSAGNAYVTGATTSTNFPALNPFQPALGGLVDAFVAKLNSSGSALIYSTYLGGAISETPQSIAVDSSGNAYVTGITSSTSFPLVNSLQALNGPSDAFVTKISPTGATLIYSTLLGGSSSDQGFAIAPDSAGNAYVAGDSFSNDFPRVGPFQNTFGGSLDGFLSKLIFRPGINPGGIVNGASFAAGAAVSAGSIVSAFGTDLTSLVRLADRVPLPTQLGDIELRVNNVPAPLFFVSGSQINFQIPWELSGQSQATVSAVAAGTTVGSATVNLSSAAPGIFTINSQGTGQGAILIANTDVVAAPATSIPGRTSRPANRGEFVTIYCTGLGEVTNRPSSGSAASANPLSTTVATPSVTIGGLTATVDFSGLAPTFVGLYQINAKVPENAPTGSAVPVVIQIGGATSKTVLMAVQ